MASTGLPRLTIAENQLLPVLPGPKKSPARTIKVRTDSDLAHIAALRAGFGIGIGICQVGLARRNPHLVRLFPREISYCLDTWLAMHEDLRDTPCCRQTFAALSEGLTRYVETK